MNADFLKNLLQNNPLMQELTKQELLNRGIAEDEIDGAIDTFLNSDVKISKNDLKEALKEFQ